MSVTFREKEKEREKVVEKVEVDEIYEFAELVKDRNQAQKIASLLMLWREYKLFQCLTGFEKACEEVKRDIIFTNKLSSHYVKMCEERIFNSLNKILQKV